MIRIPRYWTYFIFAIVCIGLAFQSNSRLFYFIGVSTSFNFLARIGLLVWVVWLFLLGTRGHVIFWSTYRISYANFYGGYKTLWILFGLGSFLLFLGSLTSSSQASYSPTPTNAPLPTHVPTKIKTPTVQASNCIHWSQISLSMEGRKICIYGTVDSIYSTNETSTRIKFNSQPNTFFLYDVNFVYPGLKGGDCVSAEEVLQLYDNKIPYMQVSALYKCESWMK